jgi:hypothetical protein
MLLPWSPEGTRFAFSAVPGCPSFCAVVSSISSSAFSSCSTAPPASTPPTAESSAGVLPTPQMHGSVPSTTNYESSCLCMHLSSHQVRSERKPREPHRKNNFQIDLLWVEPAKILPTALITFSVAHSLSSSLESAARGRQHLPGLRCLAVLRTALTHCSQI